MKAAFYRATRPGLQGLYSRAVRWIDRVVTRVSGKVVRTIYRSALHGGRAFELCRGAGRNE